MDIKLSSVRVFLAQETSPLFAIKQLEIASGSQWLIHGASGQGKTTLLHLMAGLLSPTDGYVFVGNQNLHFLSEAERCRLRRENFGIVFQRLNLIDHLTALENVELTLTPGSESNALAAEALENLGMKHRLQTRTSLLSLGEQQRVAVARVLAARPKIILADEPTSSLDSANAEAVIQGLLSVPTKPTLVVVSHDERIRGHFSRAVAFSEVCEP